jgi:hypothetical protein
VRRLRRGAIEILVELERAVADPVAVAVRPAVVCVVFEDVRVMRLGMKLGMRRNPLRDELDELTDSRLVTTRPMDYFLLNMKWPTAPPSAIPMSAEKKMFLL